MYSALAELRRPLHYKKRIKKNGLFSFLFDCLEREGEGE